VFERSGGSWRDLYTSAPDTAQHKDWRDFQRSGNASSPTKPDALVNGRKRNPDNSFIAVVELDPAISAA
jgi:hypothetical protein